MLRYIIMNKFRITKKSLPAGRQVKKSSARKGIITTEHGKVHTPVFLPCATVGAIKTLTSEEVGNLGYEIILGNSYHLYLRPGEKFIKKVGGLHKFMNWDKSILTDSGGYQVFSLGAGNRHNDKKSSVKIGERGVEFKSHLDGSKHFFTPKKVIDIQLALGSDILMVLDICTEYPATKKRAKETMEITHKWAKRSIDYWQKLKNNSSLASRRLLNKKLLFGIIQGSTYKDLREQSAKFISSLGFDGIACGGVASGGESKKYMYDVLKWVSPHLPENKPRYLMGVGEPEDIIYAVNLGYDMFDCVLPTRLARHGITYTSSKFKVQSAKLQFKVKKLDMRKSSMRHDLKVLQDDCGCMACRGSDSDRRPRAKSRGRNRYSRAYISHLVREKEILGIRLLTHHNLYFMNSLMKEIRQEII